MFKNNRGFTLIEMLIVLLVITVLIVLLIPNLSNKTEEVHSKGCDALAATVQAQVDAFYLEENNYPATLEELESASYITAEQKTCQNNKALQYNANTGEISIPND
ncbi:competence type IV pilus major pilin ComGC [Virgibacillus sp. W0430]|uniref:competence type IV pilus major pilin ComGC n=1 Tax=Virgibacillus sp. W0430 TaxID=3391580 RepID=UPI003F4544C7